MSKILDIETRRKKYSKPPENKYMTEALKDLRGYVENQGQGRILLVGQIYKERPLDTVYTTDMCRPWVIGYQIVAIDIHEGFFQRNIYLKWPGKDILEVPERDLDPVYGAIYNALLDQGADMPQIEQIARDAIKIEQKFAVTFWKEHNPNVLVPGNPAKRAIRKGPSSA
jgi:hypothetical protein